MSVDVKVCGLNTLDSVAAAVEGGAAYIGLIFYGPSPRAVTPSLARMLAAEVPQTIKKVGLFVDEADETLAATLAEVSLDMLQLHGTESPTRVAEIRRRFGLPVIKAVRLAGQADVGTAEAYVDVADRLLFDAKPPRTMKSALPGGNAVSFDWRLLAGRKWKRAWLLSGGLNAENLAEAVGVSGACAVDVSSGVEDRPGVKNPAKIRAFLAAARAL
jgi:phosphoribosylanthranilate isomerase